MLQIAVARGWCGNAENCIARILFAKTERRCSFCSKDCCNVPSSKHGISVTVWPRIFKTLIQMQMPDGSGTFWSHFKPLHIRGWVSQNILCFMRLQTLGVCFARLPEIMQVARCDSQTWNFTTMRVERKQTPRDKESLQPCQVLNGFFLFCNVLNRSHCLCLFFFHGLGVKKPAAGLYCP